MAFVPTISGNGSYGTAAISVFRRFDLFNAELSRSWHVAGPISGRSGVSDKAISDTSLRFEFLDADTIAYARRSSAARQVYREKE